MTDDELEAKLDAFLVELGKLIPAGQGEGQWRVARAAIHRAIHFVAKTKSPEFCVAATYLAEMIPHLHGLVHGADPASPKHRELH